ncbi:hypothetical protein [uncultured Draconibacterium sp.]|nr:hypothetical protein [uncultured Draconibacterium sp.]
MESNRKESISDKESFTGTELFIMWLIAFSSGALSMWLVVG